MWDTSLSLSSNYFSLWCCRRDRASHLFSLEMTSSIRRRDSIFNVSKIHVHPEYNTWPVLENDIALFRSEHISSYPSICLKESGVSATDQLCYVTGWGSVDGKSKCRGFIHSQTRHLLQCTNIMVTSFHYSFKSCIHKPPRVNHAQPVW